MSKLMTDDEGSVGQRICNRQLHKDYNAPLFNKAVQVGEIRTQISVGTSQISVGTRSGLHSSNSPNNA